MGCLCNLLLFSLDTCICEKNKYRWPTVDTFFRLDQNNEVYSMLVFKYVTLL